MSTITGSDATFLYDVGDPLRPRLVCRMKNTSVHIVTGTSFEYLVPRPNGTTDVMLHSLGSNNESVAATFAADLTGTYLGTPFPSVSWPADPTVLAYSTGGATDSSGLDTADVWVATASRATKLYNYSVPGIDGFGRPGPPAPTLAISPDGEYLVAGWSVSSSIRVFRISDGANVSPPMVDGLRFAFWARTGHTLYIVGGSVEAWSPEAGVAAVPGTIPWTLAPNFSPDSSQVTFTAVPASGGIHVYVYDFKTRASRLLVAQPRSSAIFIKAGWVWYFEETPCIQSGNNVCFDPTQPDGTVLALDLATGQESHVSFGAGEAPVQPPYPYWTGGDVSPLG
jgi:hypothetical protein